MVPRTKISARKPSIAELQSRTHPRASNAQQSGNEHVGNGRYRGGWSAYGDQYNSEGERGSEVDDESSNDGNSLVKSDDDLSVSDTSARNDARLTNSAPPTVNSTRRAEAMSRQQRDTPRRNIDWARTTSRNSCSDLRHGQDGTRDSRLSRRDHARRTKGDNATSPQHRHGKILNGELDGGIHTDTTRHSADIWRPGSGPRKGP